MPRPSWGRSVSAKAKFKSRELYEAKIEALRECANITWTSKGRPYFEPKGTLEELNAAGWDLTRIGDDK